MDFAPDAVTVDIVARAQRFLDEHVYPAEPVLEAELAATPTEWGTRPVVRRPAGAAPASRACGTCSCRAS